MTEEQNKLADCLAKCKLHVPQDKFFHGNVLVPTDLLANVIDVLREPATDAVLEAPVTVGFGVKIRSDGEIGRLTVEQYENRVVLTKEQALSLAAQIQEKVKP